MIFKLSLLVLLFIDFLDASIFAQQVDNADSDGQANLLLNQTGAHNISIAINQLIKELSLKVKDEQLVETLRADKGKLRNLHKIKSDSSALKWIQQNRFIMNRLSSLVANITEEYIVHDVMTNKNKVDHQTAEILINRISQHLTANQHKILPPGDRRLQKIEVGSGFAEGLTAIAIGKIIGFKLKGLLDHFLKKEKCKTKIKVIVVTQPTTTTVIVTQPATTTPTIPTFEPTEETPPEEPEIPDYTPPEEDEPPVEVPDYPPQDYPPIPYYYYYIDYPQDYYPEYYYYYIDYPYYYYYDYPYPYYYYYIDYPYYYYYLPPYYEYYGVPPIIQPPIVQPPIVQPAPVGQCCYQQQCCAAQNCCGGGGGGNQQQQQQSQVPIPIPFPEPIIIEQDRIVPIPEPFPIYEPIFIPQPPIYYPVPIFYPFPTGSGQAMVEDDDEDTPNVIKPLPPIPTFKNDKFGNNKNGNSGFKFANRNFNLPASDLPISEIGGSPSILSPPIMSNFPPDDHMPIPHLPSNGLTFHSHMPMRNLVKRDIDDSFINRNDSNYDSDYEQAQQRRRRRRRKGRRGNRGRKRGGRRRG